jgi:hypothetical protein
MKDKQNTSKMPCNEPQLSEAQPATKLNHVAFSYEKTTPRLPAKEDFGRHETSEMRQYCDSLDAGGVYQLVSSLVASLLERVKNSPGTGSTLGLALLARQSLSALQYLTVSERPGAAGALVNSLREAVDRLNYHATQDQEPYKKVAQSEISWPVMYSPSYSFATDTKALQARLRVGDDYFLMVMGHGSTKKKPYDFEAPTNKLVLRIIETLQANRYPVRPKDAKGGTLEGSNVPEWVKKCRGLKPLRRETVDDWAEIGWEAVCDAYDGHPEDETKGNHEIRKIGLHRKDRGKLPGSDSVYVRQGMKEEIKEALKKLARPDPQSQPNQFFRF